MKDKVGLEGEDGTDHEKVCCIYILYDRLCGDSVRLREGVSYISYTIDCDCEVRG